MTPRSFFRIVSWFTAGVAVVLGVLGFIQLANGEVFVGVPLLLVAAANAYGWVMFRTLSRRA